MKFYQLPRLTISGMLVLFLFTGCLKDNITRTYSVMLPVLADKSEVLAAVKSDAPVSIKTPGKIYMYGSYIFMNETNKGVHIIDNADPGSPRMVGFIKIPGNLDIAVKSNYLYADFFTDMLVLDISNPRDARLLKVVEGVFPERSYSSGFYIDSSKVIIDWIRKDTTVNTGEGGWDGGCFNCVSLEQFSSLSSSSRSVPGVGGSMARFAIVNNFLYLVNMSSLAAHDITTPSDPKAVSTYPLGWNIETIYPFNNQLFIGSSSGMFIFNINDPGHPVPEGMFSHARACDPVVADEEYAYVTLRTGNMCTGTSNQLDVLNVKDVRNPLLVRTYPLTNPHGLALDESTLFVCDGAAGLKVFDASDPGNLKMVDHLVGFSAFDVIAWNNNLLMVSSLGLRQYDYSDPSKLRLLSTLTIND